MSTPDPRPQDVPDEVWDAYTEPAETARERLAAALAIHERQVRERVAAEIEAQKTGCKAHPMPLPRPSCWTCGRDGAFHRAARIARGGEAT